jgi:cysteine desulfurase
MIYLDNNATTAVDPEVIAAMLPYFGENYGNASSTCTFGRKSALAVAHTREAVATLIDADPAEVVFTSGATESINLAIRGTLQARPDRPKILAAGTEHSATIESIISSPKEYNKHNLPVIQTGMPQLSEWHQQDQVQSGLTGLMVAMLANNETGVVWPIREIGDLAHGAGAWLLVDAVQAPARMRVSFRALEADLMALSSHKMHGPKGVGALVIRKGIELPPQIRGGGQESGRRAGTENVAGIVGFGRAAELARERVDTDAERIRELRDRFEAAVTTSVPDVRVTAAGSPRLCNTSHLLIRGVSSDAILARLDMDEICCSAGSACLAGAREPSHVLRAMGIPREWSDGALRVSLSRHTTGAEIDYAASRLIHHIRLLRATRYRY